MRRSYFKVATITIKIKLFQLVVTLAEWKTDKPRPRLSSRANGRHQTFRFQLWFLKQFKKYVQKRCSDTILALKAEKETLIKSQLWTESDPSTSLCPLQLGQRQSITGAWNHPWKKFQSSGSVWRVLTKKKKKREILDDVECLKAGCWRTLPSAWRAIGPVRSRWGRTRGEAARESGEPWKPNVLNWPPAWPPAAVRRGIRAEEPTCRDFSHYFGGKRACGENRGDVWDFSASASLSVDVRHVSAQLSRTTTFWTTHAFGRRGFKCQTVTASLFKSPVCHQYQWHRWVHGVVCKTRWQLLWMNRGSNH